jgi:hypothetical protein
LAPADVIALRMMGQGALEPPITPGTEMAFRATANDVRPPPPRFEPKPCWRAAKKRLAEEKRAERKRARDDKKREEYKRMSRPSDWNAATLGVKR